jgi:DNA-binding CsgD family transcriptional regulator
MSRGSSDLARLLTVMGEAHDLDDPEPFTTPVLDRLAGALDCEGASYFETDLNSGEVFPYVCSSHEASLATWPIPPRRLLTRVERTGLVKTFELVRGGVRTWSDVHSRVARWRFEVAPVEQGALGIVDRAWMAFGDPRTSSRLCWLTLERSRDFTGNQRARFLASRMHAAALIRHADVRRRLADVMVALDADEDGGTSGTILIGPTLRVKRASPAAQRIVTDWFGRSGSALPKELGDWLRSPFPREPRSIERGGMRLVIETPTRGALTLREEHLASESLTPREREVLNRVAEGLSTSEIADALFVTPATVSKHLEHIYRKLGVNGRTAALAALRGTRPS